MPPLVYAPPSINFQHHGLSQALSSKSLPSPGGAKVVLKVIGVTKSAGFQRAKHIAEALVQNVPGVFSAEFYGYNAFDFKDRRQELKKEFSNLVDNIFPDTIIIASATPKPQAKSAQRIPQIPDIFEAKRKAAQIKPVDPLDNASHRYEAAGLSRVEKNSALLTADRFVEWIKDDFGLHVKELDGEGGVTYASRAEAEFIKEISEVSHKFVYFDVQIDKVPVGRLVAEIYTDIVPITAAFFMGFVEGTAKHPKDSKERLKYSGTKVNRVIRDGWIQAGEFPTGDGPLLGETLPDENFIIEHKHRGQISMVNYGPHTNYSQFMIALKPMPYFDRKFVSIGRCVDGSHVLDAIEAAETKFERPLPDIEFVSVGELRL
ncbi:putative inactive peptidyl-prolyl cis-trans isomerase-like 6 [Phlyctochytrium planicorne]|nr:putative inactive peptidyl-prolyl cis-trans isomerase-like 6 [Phlyctochytrium planicorne]